MNTQVEEKIYTIAQLMAFGDLSEKVFEVVDKEVVPVTVRGFGNISFPKRLKDKRFSINNVKFVNGLTQVCSVQVNTEEDGRYTHYVLPSVRVKEIVERTEQVENLLLANKLAVEASKIYEVLNKEHIGADPEIFAENKDGGVIPAFHYLKSSAQDTETYWDGYQGEFTVVPSHCIAYVVDSIQERLNKLTTLLHEHDPEAHLSLVNTFTIPEEMLLKDDKKYVSFGCTPSKSVYGEKFPNINSREVPFRSAGGHLHFTVKEERKANIPEAIKWLDKVLGVIAVSMFEYYDDPRRRTLYGKAGEYRLPIYGFEYRVLSNAWLCHPAVAHFIYDMARRAAGFGLYGKPFALWDITEDEARQCINTCDVGMARKLLERNSFGLKVLLKSYYSCSEATLDKWKSMVMTGVHNYLSNPDRLSVAWRLKGNDGYRGWMRHSEANLACMANCDDVLLRTNKLD